MEMPLPRVINPMIGSPGSGEQHFAKEVRTFCLPPTATGETGLDRILEINVLRVLLAGFWASGKRSLLIFDMDVAPEDMDR